MEHILEVKGANDAPTHRGMLSCDVCTATLAELACGQNPGVPPAAPRISVSNTWPASCTDYPRGNEGIRRHLDIHAEEI